MPRKNNRRHPPKKRVYFKLKAPKAEEVTLCGTFNNWETHSQRLRRDKKGVWGTSLVLEPGTYEYRFLVDGEWQNDPDAEMVAPNPYGTQNCVRMVV
ncbi:MAG: hypothetical protein A3F84_18790 [Candidatus Handelsmanbacteria bacterium RIFCSPLOWO2_12_FULL_64_10]|uniref:AMP-activated protein kinase glycogen-binding domain-containing protein n=1 Tax=Handelsmanbacteria sp. (strain RIFCSPLOWO2_12_FULL_64_10) TaxID=1817868 RepID=A0A1F6D289_HANXR|nr:MAG: hypothetical protein A3F84_18790 [Candidatus Handelsmanbacteria bacterium RIFCSPLOWO2_12_FULL_64_10]